MNLAYLLNYISIQFLLSLFQANEIYSIVKDLPLAFESDFQPSFGLGLILIAVIATDQPYFRPLGTRCRIRQQVPREELTRDVWSPTSVEPLSTRRRLGEQN